MSHNLFNYPIFEHTDFFQVFIIKNNIGMNTHPEAHYLVKTMIFLDKGENCVSF